MDSWCFGNKILLGLNYFKKSEFLIHWVILLWSPVWSKWKHFLRTRVWPYSVLLVSLYNENLQMGLVYVQTALLVTLGIKNTWFRGHFLTRWIKHLLSLSATFRPIQLENLNRFEYRLCKGSIQNKKCPKKWKNYETYYRSARLQVLTSFEQFLRILNYF